MNFGILCNGNCLQQWQLETIKHLVSGGHIFSLLIVNAEPVPHRQFYEKLLNYPYSKFICRAWFRYMIKPAAKQNVDISDYYQNLPEVSCVTMRKGYAEYFQHEDIESIKSYKLDFILRFGFGIIKGDILEGAKYGVWSYHHDDDRKYRGVPTGFWEIWFNDPVNAAILQQLTNQIDSGIILHKAYFATINHSWQANLDNLLKSTTEWPLQVCRDIENGNTEFLSVKNSPESAIYKLPGNLKMFLFLLKVFKNKFRFHFRDLFITEKWNVGIIPIEAAELVKQGEFTIPEPIWLDLVAKKSEYHADPFGFVQDGHFHIVCEEYDYSSAQGVLTSWEIERESGKVQRKSNALTKNYHLAYPYLFEYEGIQYCIPENSEAGNVDLYSFDITNGALVFEQTLIENLQAVDPSLFFYDGFWWLFFTDRVSTNERLHIWYSASLLGPYTAHANNPVKVDIRSSRPAGNPFVIDGKLFRPAQDCSIRSGRRICINQVLSITPTSFYEKEFTLLNPGNNSKYSKGMHTFCITGGAVIVDGKRESFIWQAFRRKLTGKFNKLVKYSS
jgi:hypothetical protein